ncbi:MAG: radical SAM family heme chaperone HemW [bacterium]|nr:radical SAM family heme chaperone HemW [bacterium]
MLPPDSIELADLAARWRSAYVHIPFCRRRCPYCDFAVVAPGDANTANLPELRDSYLAALHAEIDMEPEWEPLDAVNFGGGTPSSVGAEALGGLIDHLDSRFGLAAGAEVSIEVNPEDVTEEMADALVARRVNRVSIGVQSFDDDVLETLGRAHSSEQAAAAVAICQSRFVTGIDVIFGSAGESLASWRSTVERAVELHPHHLSTYALTVETGTELWRQVRAGGKAPDSDDLADKYELAQELAVAADLVQYEVSNYARPGNTCRYNLATWGQGEYLGFGLGGHGHRDSVRRRNVRSVAAYVAACEAGARPEAGSAVTDDPEMERLVLGVRRMCGVDLGNREAAADSHPGLERLAAAGVIEIARGRLRVLRPLLTDDVAATVLSLSP